METGFTLVEKDSPTQTPPPTVRRLGDITDTVDIEELKAQERELLQAAGLNQDVFSDEKDENEEVLRMGTGISPTNDKVLEMELYDSIQPGNKIMYTITVANDLKLNQAIRTLRRVIVSEEKGLRPTERLKGLEMYFKLIGVMSDNRGKQIGSRKRKTLTVNQ